MEQALLSIGFFMGSGIPPACSLCAGPLYLLAE